MIVSVHGCARNGGGLRPSLPWNRQPTTAANPWAVPSDSGVASLPNAAPPSNARRFSFLSELRKRADQQENLAETQRRRLEELQRLQADLDQKEQLLAAQEREKERRELAAKYSAKEKEMLGRVDQMKGRADRLQGRAGDLDANNRDLHAQIARSQKENALLQEEIDLLRGRLQTTAQQLSQSQQYGQVSDQRLQALQASARRRAGASITANSSLTQGITAVLVPGMDIRQDGDLVRIALPSDKLFMRGTANLHQGSQPYMDQVARVLLEHYPRQMAGVEAHTDDRTDLSGTQWRNQHQLTAAQSMAVFEQLASRNINPHQLFVIGHGGNHPKYSDGTPQGQTMNRRVEVVVYPETYPPR
jgi:flagellar motor protein MotB